MEIHRERRELDASTTRIIEDAFVSEHAKQKPVLLALDTSLGTSVALYSQGFAYERRSDDRFAHLELIGTFLEEVFAEAAVKASEVSAVIMGTGPGSYTGLRIGMAAAQAFALARHIPLLPLCSHEALACESGRGAIRIVQDARRSEFFVSEWVKDAEGGLQCRREPFVLARADYEENAEDLHAQHLLGYGLILAAALRKRASRPFADRSPLYLRAPDASVSKKKPLLPALNNTPEQKGAKSSLPPLRIRTASAADAARLTPLETRIFGATAWSYDLLHSELTGEFRNYLILETRDASPRILGYAGLLSLGELGDIQTIALEEEARGHGLGALLLHGLLIFAHTNSVSHVLLEVKETNARAISLYQQNGFQIIDRRKAYYQPENVDALIMRLEASRIPHILERAGIQMGAEMREDDCVDLLNKRLSEIQGM